MDKITKNLIPILIILLAFWVFNKAIVGASLWVYKIFGSSMTTVSENISATQKQALDLLDTQKKLIVAEEALEALELEKLTLVAQALELKRIEKQLKFKPSFYKDLITVKAIGRSPNSWHKQLIINKGLKDGIEVGAGVISNKAVLGQVEKVSNETAVVKLAQDPSFRMGIKISSTGELGVLNGAYPGPTSIEFIRVDSKVAVGDTVLSSGVCIDLNNCPYPANYPVGIVSEVLRVPEIVDLVVKVELSDKAKKLGKIYVFKK